ncbi:DUF2515 family protein [Oceanobacillus manasiensis]|uniref:DUF2515 family protein n=1 Tax=Oceanobacillus manasiensis TaxID=586413 RepID=UPI0005A8AE4F|nr:DUF2515 family protein [Oceanobacillus manasiensis]
MYGKESLDSYIHYIINTTNKHNKDNITRTKAYLNFYMDCPEIKWAFLASMVSRNAGWNMTDLHLPPFKKMLGREERNQLFMTYERANWLIFSDAFPQLLVYKLSKQIGKPMFHLLKWLHVSKFMVNQWKLFWKRQEQNRLMLSLIINEQNVIQGPVVKHTYFQYHVFKQLPYMMQNFLRLNAVLLPTSNTEIYGASVQGFTNITKRIRLGVQLANILYTPNVYDKFLLFAKTQEHTGSRKDYETFFDSHYSHAPILRVLYPVIKHQDNIREDWWKIGGVPSKWWHEPKVTALEDMKKTYYRKRDLLYGYYYMKYAIKPDW